MCYNRGNVMEPITESLDIIIRKCPSLSPGAVKAKLLTGPARASATLELIPEALKSSRLTLAEREVLIGAIQPPGPSPQARTRQLPPIRVTPDQYDEIEAEGRELGVGMSEAARRRLFGREVTP